MLIPSKTLHTYLLNVAHGMFFETVNIGTEYSKVDIAAKLPTEIIKHIFCGTSTFLSMKLIPIRNSLALCTFLAVEDDPNNMFYIGCTHSPKNIDIVIQFLNQGKTHLHIFDELNRNVSSFDVSFYVSDDVIKNIHDVTPRICQLTAKEIKIIFHKVEGELSQDSSTLKAIRFEFNDRNEINFIQHPPVANAPIYDPNRFKYPYHISDNNQGRQFEINLTHLLSKIFGIGCLFPSPFKATQNSMNREFIDLVVVWENCLLFFEAKANSITPESTQRSTKRRVLSVEKQIKKAIRQLRGAYRKAAYDGILTLRTVSSNIEINLSLFSTHLIIIVSEVHPDLDKSDIVGEIISLGKELAVGVHLMDFHTLSTHIRKSSSAREFVDILNCRWTISMNHNTIFFKYE